MAYSWKKQATAAYGCALARLALHLYGYVEVMGEDWEQAPGEPLWRTFQKGLGQYLQEEAEAGETLLGLRGQLQERMEALTSYVDALYNYEYVLTRAGRRYRKDPQEEEGIPGGFMGTLMRYLTESKDTALLNQRMEEVIGQLPVRFTRKKFFGLVRDALMAYEGGEKRSLDAMIRILDDISMVTLTAERRARIPALDETVRTLESLSYRELSREDYEKGDACLKEGEDLLSRLSDSCVYLEELTNDLLILTMTRGDALADVEEERHAYAILQSISRRGDEENPGPLEPMEESLAHLEGFQEKYDENYQRLDIPSGEDGSAAGGAAADRESSAAGGAAADKEGSAVGDAAMDRESSAAGGEGSGTREPLDAQAAARQVDRLMSTSAFADLKPEEDGGTVTAQDVEEAAQAFFDRVEPVLAASQKPVARAVMAACLSQLPRVFRSLAELRDYIQNSLDCCTDPSEKGASIDRICTMMEMDGYELV